jgi:hypothetical protein
MALVFHRRMTIPLSVTAFLVVALTTPQPPRLLLMLPATLLAIAVAGIVLIVFTMPGAIPWLRTSRSRVRVLPHRHRAVDARHRPTADDALDCARMDDDGGWQVARPPA